MKNSNIVVTEKAKEFEAAPDYVDNELKRNEKVRSTTESAETKEMIESQQIHKHSLPSRANNL